MKQLLIILIAPILAITLMSATSSTTDNTTEDGIDQKVQVSIDQKVKEKYSTIFFDETYKVHTYIIVKTPDITFKDHIYKVVFEKEEIQPELQVQKETADSLVEYYKHL